MKKIILSIILLGSLFAYTPVFAAWYNPFSWFAYPVKIQPAIQTTANIPQTQNTTAPACDTSSKDNIINQQTQTIADLQNQLDQMKQAAKDATNKYFDCLKNGVASDKATVDSVYSDCNTALDNFKNQAISSCDAALSKSSQDCSNLVSTILDRCSASCPSAPVVQTVPQITSPTHCSFMTSPTSSGTIGEMNCY